MLWRAKLRAILCLARAVKMSETSLLAAEFATLPDLVRAHAAERPNDSAVADQDGRLSWGAFDALVDRIAARLQREGVGPGKATALAGYNSVAQVAVLVATLTTHPALTVSDFNVI